MAVTALVTLLLALTTVKATEQSNLREKNRRTDEIEKEKRDRDERLLNEVIEWATDIKRCGWEVEYTIPIDTTRVDIEMFQLQMSANRFSRFMVPSAKNKYVTEIALILGENLCLAVKDTKKQLDNFLAKLQKTLSLSVKEIKEQSKNLECYEKALYNSTDRVIEEAVKIKTRNLT